MIFLHLLLLKCSNIVTIPSNINSPNKKSQKEDILYELNEIKEKLCSIQTRLVKKVNMSLEFVIKSRSLEEYYEKVYNYKIAEIIDKIVRLEKFLYKNVKEDEFNERDVEVDEQMFNEWERVDSEEPEWETINSN